MTGSRAGPRPFALLALASVALLSGHTSEHAPVSSLLLLIDTSGSMWGTRRAAARRWPRRCSSPTAS